jgi:hypothetical protein
MSWCSKSVVSALVLSNYEFDAILVPLVAPLVVPMDALA